MVSKKRRHTAEKANVATWSDDPTNAPPGAQAADDGASTLRGAQVAVDASIAALGGYWPPLANLARLFEECGELARAVNQTYGPKRRKPDEISGEASEELGDALYTLLALANSLELDARAALAGALRKARARAMANATKRESRGDAGMDLSSDTSVERAFTTSLSQLYAGLADADPLAAPRGAAAEADAVAAVFAAAPTETRARLLLRALDEAIAAVEGAAELADMYHGAEASPTTVDAVALRSAYSAFTAGQPSYQSLYHYRNALATRLRQTEHSLPPEVAHGESADETLPPTH